MKKLNKLLNLMLPLITIAFLLVVWTLVAVAEDNEFIVPTVQSALKQLALLFGEKEFYTALLYTVIRSIIAFLLSIKVEMP